MNTEEFSREFDILYDNISSNGAPGFNNYEKSLLLTRAQDEIIRENYSPYNKSQKSFESSENRRRELNELVVPYVSTVSFTSNLGLDPNSTFFVVPDNIYYIIQEQIKVTSKDTCINNSVIGVIPTTHDEYNVNKKSPFRKPNKRKAWRFDLSEINDTAVVEIISQYTPISYNFRYIKKPIPIILSDFESDPELQGMGLTVDGLNTITECELNAEIHRDIINRAVELAIRGYRENTLQSNVELNKRNV